MSRLSFSERMAEGKSIAADRRYKGQSVGCHSSWKATKVHRALDLDALEQYFNQWRKDQHYHAYLAVEAALFPDLMRF